MDGFRFDGAPMAWERLSGGHIHQNFLVTCPGGRYVLQRINERVFPDVAVVLSNVERLVVHLGAGGRNPPRLVATRDGALSLRTSDDGVWRAFHYLEGTVGRASPHGPTDAFEAGWAFADYVVALADLGDPPLAVTIERFHDLPGRLAVLDAIAAEDPVGRRADVGPELDRSGRLGRQIADALCYDAAPVRTVHNDAKLSNVRFDSETGLTASVIDLDTTMPGLLRHDVGELVRTATTHAPEDAPEAAGVDYDLELLEALCAGYFSGHGGLEPSEIDTLAWAGPEMAVENAVRFLTDHLAGDRYFAVERPAQNLDRCRTQLRLAELMLECFPESAASFARASDQSPSSVPPTAT